MTKKEIKTLLVTLLKNKKSQTVTNLELNSYLSADDADILSECVVELSEEKIIRVNPGSLCKGHNFASFS
ncbi:hypothetical protein ACQ0P8_04035 [Halodesulfovibrio aestuarii]|uniref:hypothetical protein n=1 Tax=Halodesulfovibrio aestuarii TaxID=126333 RepID=UPI000371AFA7|nr:hypothetical protein [Halodesulfovibrio aestuarii]